MKAVIAERPGGPEVLKIVDRADPTPGSGETLVDVAAAGVNRADVLQRRGAYPPPAGASDVLGLELAGRLVTAAPGFSAGARVMALVGGGAYASRAAVPVAHLMAVPDDLSLQEAAAVPEAFLTAYHNLFDLGGLSAGETVLIHAAASGVGTAAIQLARQAGARVIATARSEQKLERCRELGATAAIVVENERFAEAVRRQNGGEGVNLILDFIGASYWNENIASLARGGRMALIGTLGGSRAEMDIGALMRNCLRLAGSTLRGQSLEEKAGLVGRAYPTLTRGLSEGTLRPVIDRVLPLEAAAEAHRLMESNVTVGKIVLAL